MGVASAIKRFFRGSKVRSVWGVPASDLHFRLEGSELAKYVRSTLPAGPDRPEPLQIESVTVRPAQGPDHLALERVRHSNRPWLQQWEATLPAGSAEKAPTVDSYPRLMDQQMEDGTGLVMIVEVNDEPAGVVTVGAVFRGPMQTGVLGYWIAERWANLGVTSLAVAVTLEMLLTDLGLHRVEVNVRPENQPSLRLCEKLGLREEAYKPRYMNIGGQWADHVGFAIDQEMLQLQPLLPLLDRS